MMITRHTVFLSLFTTLLVFAAPALAEKRVALVIGNANYKHENSLQNPLNDAKKLKEALQRLGFSVTFKTDLPHAALNSTLGEFSEIAAGADLALIYFSGHGIEVEGTNYLIPTDAKLNHSRQINYQAIPFYQVAEAVSDVTKLGIIILDACRDNPFRGRMVKAGGTKSLGKGLSRVANTPNTLVAYAAKHGTVALDGEEENSPYVQGLLKYIEQPGLEIGLMFRKVRDEVSSLTNGAQLPYVYGSITGEEIFLKTGKKLESSSQNEVERLRRELIEKEKLISDTLKKFEAIRKQGRQSKEEIDALKEQLASLQEKGEVVKTEPKSLTNKKSTLLPDSAKQIQNIHDELEATSKTNKIKLLQLSLVQKGYDPGPVDGQLGAKTIKAIRNFQKKTGRSVTGKMSSDLLSVLTETKQDQFTRTDFFWEYGNDQLDGIMAMDANPATSTVAAIDTATNFQAWNIRTKQTRNVKFSPGHGALVWNMAFSTDGELIAFAKRGALTVLNTKTGTPVLEKDFEVPAEEGHSKSVLDVAFSPDGQSLAAAIDDSNILVFDVETAEQRLVLSGHQNAATSVNFSADGRKILSTSEDNSVRVWNAQSGKEIIVLSGHDDTVNKAVFDRTGARVISVSKDGSIRIWDIAAGSHIRTLAQNSAEVTDIALSPDGRQFATASGDKTVKLWDAKTYTLIASLAHPLEDEYGIRNVKFGKTSSTIFTAADDGIVRLWQRAQPKDKPVLSKQRSADIWNKMVTMDCLSLTDNHEFKVRKDDQRCVRLEKQLIKARQIENGG